MNGAADLDLADLHDALDLAVDTLAGMAGIVAHLAEIHRQSIDESRLPVAAAWRGDIDEVAFAANRTVDDVAKGETGGRRADRVQSPAATGGESSVSEINALHPVTRETR
ncbi:MAG: hypothetical protein KF723_22790 [Rhizobiaceae bacterium]|nr:hypothetical protein [Rhizobiaceae bacterium]